MDETSGGIGPFERSGTPNAAGACPLESPSPVTIVTGNRDLREPLLTPEARAPSEQRFFVSRYWAGEARLLRRLRWTRDPTSLRAAERARSHVRNPPSRPSASYLPA